MKRSLSPDSLFVWFLVQMLVVFVSFPRMGVSSTLESGRPELAGSKDSAVTHESFFDDLILPLMADLNIPGVCIALVKGKEVLLSKGYGYANLKNEVIVDPEKSIFRVASVSKVLTVTAVMQLVEQGRLDVNADINSYLNDLQVPQTFSEPITLAHLITHTAGFDDSRIALATLSQSKITPLGAFLSTRLPGRIIPPGREYSYSRYGIALAGHIVKAVSGKSFPDYIHESILKPLRMSRSGFDYPENYREDLAAGYTFDGNDLEVVPYYHFFTAPEASFNSTAADMARFMIAHLNEGRYRNNLILQPETVELMHTQHFTHHANLPGLAYGFYERFENGVRAIQHGGHIPGFVSRLLLIPEHDLGLFIACNNDRFKLISKVTDAFFDRYVPVFEKHISRSTKTNQPIPFSTQPDQGQFRFAGTYRTNEYARHSIEKIFSLKKQFKISRVDDGLLVKGSKNLVQVDSLTFVERRAEKRSVFLADKSGEIVAWLDKRFIYHKLKFYETAQFHIILIIVMSAFFVSGFLLWAGRNVPVFRISFLHDRIEANGVFRLAGVISLLNLLFLGGLLFLLATFNRIDEFTFGIPSWIIGLLCLPMASAALTTGLLAAQLKIFFSQSFSLTSRLYFSLLTLNAVVFLLFLNYWNFIGFHF